MAIFFWMTWIQGHNRKKLSHAQFHQEGTDGGRLLAYWRTGCVVGWCILKMPLMGIVEKEGSRNEIPKQLMLVYMWYNSRDIPSGMILI